MPPAEATPTVAEVGELGLLARLQRWLAPDGGDLLAGAGDDAAVWQPPLGRAIVATTDSLVQDHHFRQPLTISAATDLGWKLLAVSLSDLAAMGARPGPAFIALALPGWWPVAWVDALYQGLAECAVHSGVALAGGNISASATAVLTSTCLGSVDPPALLRRRGARAGWQLAVTGPLGGAAAALRVRDRPGSFTAGRPAPRLEAGRILAGLGVGVAIDVSDGVFVDAARLLEGDPGPGLVIDAAALPVAVGIRERWPRQWLEVVGGGEDYELLFAAPPGLMTRALSALRRAGLEPAAMGRFDDGDGLRLLVDGREGPAPRSGHQHFRA